MLWTPFVLTRPRDGVVWQAESTTGESEVVTVAWSSSEEETASALAAAQGEEVVLEMELRGGVSLFSFEFA